jgi:GT2 family glycosyltransferase
MDKILKSVSVVIPNYNGFELIKKNLPPLIRAADKLTAPWEIIIVDDGSTDESVNFISNNYPSIILLTSEVNRGFAETINRGIFAARYDVVVALNNDVVVENDFFEKILLRFSDPEVFAISPNMINSKNGLTQTYKLKPGFCWFKIFAIQTSELSNLKREIPLFYVTGGASFYDRKKLMLLGGFDTIYAPFYAEDIDLSYQAWKAGWKCLLEPSVTVLHENNTTISKYNKKRKIKFIAARNRVIFLWLNITNKRLILIYLLLFIPSLIWYIYSFRKYRLVGTFMAFVKLPEIIKGRRKRKRLSVVDDRKIMKIVSIPLDIPENWSTSKSLFSDIYRYLLTHLIVG